MSDFELELLEQAFVGAGVPTKRSGGELHVKCSDATYAYVMGARTSYDVPVLCGCLQREFPHELCIHGNVRREAFNPAFRWRWPWSLMLSAREEPSTETQV